MNNNIHASILTIFIVTMLLVFYTMLNSIRRNFYLATNLYSECKNITLSLKDKQPTDLKEFQKNVFVYIFSKEGDLIFVDTLEHDYFEKGKEPEPEEKALFHKMSERDTLFTHHVMNDYLHIIAVAKKCTEKYCVICFSKI